MNAKTNTYTIFGVVVLVGVICWQLTLLYARLFSTNIVPSAVLIGVDKIAQMKFILKNPFRFLVVTFVDGFRKSFYIGEYGLFGHLDLIAKLTTIIVPIHIVVCSCISYGNTKDTKKKNTIFLSSLLVLMYIVISAGFYVVDSSLGSSTILGIQARYFIPCIFIASSLIANLFSEYIRIVSSRKAVSFTIYSSFVVSLIAAIEVFAGYYLK